MCRMARRHSDRSTKVNAARHRAATSRTSHPNPTSSAAFNGVTRRRDVARFVVAITVGGVYRPPAFAEDDPAAIVALARQAGFGHLVVIEDGHPISTPMP